MGFFGEALRLKMAKLCVLSQEHVIVEAGVDVDVFVVVEVVVADALVGEAPWRYLAIEFENA